MLNPIRSSFPRPVILALLFFIFGLFYFALTPPGQGIDEEGHFYRAFQVSDGVAIGEKNEGREGGEIPKVASSVFETSGALDEHPETRLSLLQWRKWMLESPPLDREQLSNREYRSFAPMVLYSPVAYLPQAFAIDIACVFSFTAFETFYLAHFFSLVFASLCIFICLSLLSFSTQLSLIFVLILAMPMCIFQLSSVSADVVTDCFAFLCCATTFSLSKNWDRKVFVLLLLSAMGLSFCKTFYLFIPMAALLPILHVPALRGSERLKHALLLIACCFLPALIWGIASNGSYVPVRGNVPEQLSFVVGHPFFFLKALYGTVLVDWKWYLHTFFGVLGPMSAPTPPGFVVIYILTLIGASVSRYKPTLDKTNTWLNIGLAVVTAFMLFFGQYLYWSYVGASHIEGIQGRYFIPLAFLFFFSLPTLRAKFLASPYFTYYALAMCFIAQIVGVRTLLLRYWL